MSCTHKLLLIISHNDTSCIILTMYGAVNKKVSGWELASCNNKMHDLSTADPSVSILLHSTLRKENTRVGVLGSTVGQMSVCVFDSPFAWDRNEEAHNNRFTWSIIIDCRFFSFALYLILINHFYYYYSILKPELKLWFLFKVLLLLDQIYFCQYLNTL